MGSPIILLSMQILLATYLVQAVQVFLIKISSAGSTVEMLLNVKAHGGGSPNHPARQFCISKLKLAMMITATAIATIIFILPLIVTLFPVVTDFLLPLSAEPPESFLPAGMLLLIFGNRYRRYKQKTGKYYPRIKS